MPSRDYVNGHSLSEELRFAISGSITGINIDNG